jgi:hypothetical protein
VDAVHVFVAHGRFASEAELDSFVVSTYTEDGDMVPSQFMRETGLREYQPGWIERLHSPTPLPLRDLLRDVSCADQWIHRVDASLVADSAICVFSQIDVYLGRMNALNHPQRTSMQYVGAFPYRVISTYSG